MVFPEATLSGYPKGADFGARVGGRLARCREEFLEYYNGAIDVPGPHTEQIAEIVHSHFSLLMIVLIVNNIGIFIFESKSKS
ncbi:hypothetical protein [Oligella ureolytica]|uniref:hypothetical protein n=1 Tax=Oligella ureolytica TaxID=90244 RepID=UPI001E37AA90